MIKKLGLIAATTLLLSACGGKSTPNCSSSDAIDLVKDITRSELATYIGQDQANAVSINLSGIRTRDRNEDLDTYGCAAEITIAHEGQTHTDQITYTIEPTDASGEFYVEVFGL